MILLLFAVHVYYFDRIRVFRGKGRTTDRAEAVSSPESS
jgi:hypothetical protein